MANFKKNLFATPFGRNVFLRSTQDVKTMSRTCSRLTVPSQTIDTYANQQVLQPGMVMAKITGSTKCGPFQAAGTDEVQTITKAGTWTSGTYTMTVLGATTGNIAMAATATTIQTAVRAAVLAANPAYEVTSIEVTGGPLSTTAVVVTFNASAGVNVALSTVDATNIVGGGTATAVETTPGVAGATDGRSILTNILGFNNTFLPWQLMERDVEIAIIYEASVVQANCLMLNAAGVAVPVDDTTAAAMFGKKSLDIKFF